MPRKSAMYVEVQERDLRVISRLWNELAEFPVAQSDSALRYALQEVARLVGAGNAFWVGAHRSNATSDICDPRAWSITGLSNLMRSPKVLKAGEQQRRRFSEGLVDPTTAVLISRAGATRSVLRQELLDENAWRRGWIYNEVFRPLGIGDRLVGAHTIDPFNESYIGLERDTRAKPFGERERDLLYLFLAGAREFHRRLLETETHQRLTPREQAVLALLLTRRSEREIARELSIRHRTTHQYVVAILRKFGVSGRVGLMAHFLEKKR